MARTASVFARVEPEVKEQAEQVLDRLGIPMSNAVGMFLRQIVLQRGIPFEMKLPSCEEPVSYGSLTKEQFSIEIEKGMEDIKAGRLNGLWLLFEAWIPCQKEIAFKRKNHGTAEDFDFSRWTITWYFTR